eukprot:COSAG01_NODE_21183_length_914_cov_0.970552_2_plen_207_part_00
MPAPPETAGPCTGRRAVAVAEGTAAGSNSTCCSSARSQTNSDKNKHMGTLLLRAVAGCWLAGWPRGAWPDATVWVRGPLCDGTAAMGQPLPYGSGGPAFVRIQGRRIPLFPRTAASEGGGGGRAAEKPLQRNSKQLAACRQAWQALQAAAGCWPAARARNAGVTAARCVHEAADRQQPSWLAMIGFQRQNSKNPQSALPAIKLHPK